MNSDLNIVLVDDHTIFREGICRLLEVEYGFNIVGHCATLYEASALISEHRVDVLILDYDLDGEEGIELLQRLHREQAATRPKILMLTAGMQPSAILNSLDAGACGVLLKHSGARQLIEAVRRVAIGEAWWDTSVLRSALVNARDISDTAPQTKELTERQKAVLRCILSGLTNKEIAHKLQVSETAIKASIQELFAKAQVRTRSQLVRVAIEKFSSQWLTAQVER